MTNPAEQHQPSSSPVPGSAAPVSPPELQFPSPSSADGAEKAKRQEAEERKQVEEHLSLLESAVRQSNDSILITTAQLDLPGPQIVFVNPAFTRMTQYTAAEALGKTPRLLQGPRTEREVLDRLREDLNREQSFFGETYNYRKDGSEFVMEWEIAAVRDQQEVIMHYLATQRDVTERRRDQARLRQQFEQMTALRAIDVSIMNHWELHLTLNLILGQIRVLLGVDAAAVLRLNRPSNHLDYAAVQGFADLTLFLDSVSIGEKPAGRAAAERQMLTIEDIQNEDIQNEPSFLQTGPLAKEGFQDYYAVPLMAKEQVLGVLELFHRTPLEPNAEWLHFLEAITGQAAIAIENATLFADLQQANSELLRSYTAAIEGWSRALDLRDKETEGHSERVTEMTMRLAETMGIPESEWIHLRRGALLHDIGKMGIPDTILLKPGPLTEEEWEVMRRHPEYAYELLYPMTFLRPALAIPIAHHEKWDGTGYPHGLKGEQIPLAARIFAVADVWDALRSDRPYRKGWPVERVREHLRSLAGTHFDPQIVETFLRLNAERA
jgi:PAS domain S-box-containing protein